MTSSSTGHEQRPSRRDFNLQLYEDIAPGYYDQVLERGRGIQWFWHFERYAAVAANLPSDGMAILDLGCGPGTFLGNYAGRFDTALGVDLARAQIDYAKAKYGTERVRFEAGNAMRYVRERQFDAVVSIEVIEHLPVEETQPFLQSVFQLLSPGGTLILATPNYSSLWPVIEWFVSKAGPVDYLEQHINRFTIERLAQELAAAGFRVQHRRTIFLISPFFAFISSSLAKWVYSLEQRFLPWLGSEIVISAKRRSEAESS